MLNWSWMLRLTVASVIWLSNFYDVMFNILTSEYWETHIWHVWNLCRHPIKRDVEHYSASETTYILLDGAQSATCCALSDNCFWTSSLDNILFCCERSYHHQTSLVMHSSSVADCQSLNLRYLLFRATIYHLSWISQPESGWPHGLETKYMNFNTLESSLIMSMYRFCSHLHSCELQWRRSVVCF